MISVGVTRMHSSKDHREWVKIHLVNTSDLRTCLEKCLQEVGCRQNLLIYLEECMVEEQHSEWEAGME